MNLKIVCVIAVLLAGLALAATFADFQEGFNQNAAKTKQQQKTQNPVTTGITPPIAGTSGLANANKSVATATAAQASSPSALSSPSAPSSSSSALSLPTPSATNSAAPYNHYTGQSEPILSGTYVANNDKDGIVSVISPDALQLTYSNGQSVTLVKKIQNKEGFTNSAYGSFVSYEGAGGVKATAVTSADGSTVIRVDKPNGQVVYYTNLASPSYNTSPTSNTSSTNTSPTTSTSTTSSTSPTNSNSSTNTSSNSSASSTSSNSSTSSANYSPPNDYSSSLPPGIPASMIPPGQEDLYILKSEIVPPVCPACPSCKNKSGSGKDCPKCRCPAPMPCPDSPFECKKVPNYSAVNNYTLPVPVLPDFTSFGM